MCGVRSLPRQPGPGLSPESYVYNLLYEVPVPLPGQALRLYVPPSEPHLDPIPVVSRKCNYILFKYIQYILVIPMIKGPLSFH